ncbi:MAG: cation:proton antiporter, partial [Pseudomonadales bacterium]
MFEERGESGAFHAHIAIGILVIQDIIAVIYLVLASGTPPHILSPALLGLLLLRPLLLYLLQLARHGELVLLFGFAVALGGAALFELADLKGGLGALTLGMLLAGTPRAKELYSSLAELKDLFLIGFFLQIGYYGLPTGAMWIVAAALSLLILLRPAIYFLLFTAFKLRTRTSLLGAASLFSYSEFGLVVATVAVANGLLTPDWLTTIALAVSISFVMATPFNTKIHLLYSRYGQLFHRAERAKRIPAEVPANLGDAEVVVLGMGRVGQGAYKTLRSDFGERIVGVDENYEKVGVHRAAGLKCVRGDATDYDFWAHSGMGEGKLVLVCLPNHE